MNKPKRETSKETKSTYNLDLRLLASRKMKKITFFCLSHPACDILLCSPSKPIQSVIEVMQSKPWKWPLITPGGSGSIK